MAENKVDNGVNVEALLGARAALTDAPAGAKFTWRATCKWINGTHSRSTVNGFFGLGEEQNHKTEFNFDSDHPEIFASEDKGATPVELVLSGLAGCLTAGIAAVAQNREIQLKSVKATLEGGMDIQGILGIDKDVRTGFDGIKVTYTIDADASKDDIEALNRECQGLSGAQRRGCFHGLGIAQLPAVFDDPAQLARACKQGSREDRVLCVEGVVEKLSDYDEDAARQACASLEGELAKVCATAAAEKMYRLDKPSLPLYTGK